MCVPGSYVQCTYIDTDRSDPSGGDGFVAPLVAPPALTIATDLPRFSVPDGAGSLLLKCQFEGKVVPLTCKYF